MSPQRIPFIDHLAAAARAAYPDGALEVAGETSITLGIGGTRNSIDAAQVRYDTRDLDDAGVRDACDRFIRGLFVDADGEEVPWDRLLPLVRSGVNVVDNEQAGVVYRHLNDYLVEEVAVDFSDSLAIVAKRHLAKWGIEDPTALFERARANLAAQFTTTSFQFDTTDEGVALLVGREPYGYQTSWAVVPDVVRSLVRWEQNGQVVQAEPLVFFPSRSNLIVVPDSHVDLVKAAFEATQEIYDEHPRRMASAAFHVTPNGGLELWRPPVGHPLYERQRLAVAVQDVTVLILNHRHLEHQALGFQAYHDYLSLAAQPAAGLVEPVREGRASRVETPR